MRRDQQQRELYAPVDKVAQQALARGPRGPWQGVGKAGVAGPDGRQDGGDAGAAVGALDAEPEEREDGARGDAEVAEPVPVAGAAGDREGDVQVRADGAVEHGWYCVTLKTVSQPVSQSSFSANEEAHVTGLGTYYSRNKDNQNRIGRRQARRHYGTGGRPC